MISSEQVKALIRNKSTTLNINSNIILRIVIFELFLEKLSMSAYKEKFIIKGGFLVSAITKIDLRTTMDLDITLKSLSIKENDLKTYKIKINLQKFSRVRSFENILRIKSFHSYHIQIKRGCSTEQPLLFIDFVNY